jgi:hypothetical protein
MIKFLGFLMGSAVSIGAILLLLGVPEIRLKPDSPYIAQVQEPLPQPAPEPIQSMIPEQPTAEQPAAMSRQPTPPATPAEAEQAVAPLAPQWHSFWSPFGSQIAANGFVSRLETLTGFDYRVVKISTGVYDVAFAYTDESERIDKLSMIASAAALDLPET